MTVIVQKDGIFYADSRRMGHLGITSDDIVKISVQPSNRDVEKFGTWEGEPILAIAGSGSADGIGVVTQLLFDRGDEAVNYYRALRSKGFAKSFDCSLIVVTANKAIGIIFNKTNDLSSVRISKYKRHERIVVGSGAAATAVAGRLFRTDEVGLVCAAIAMTDSCGGNVLMYDTNVKDARIVSRHYAYPRLRVLWGGVRVLSTVVGTWFNQLFPY